MTRPHNDPCGVACFEVNDVTLFARLLCCTIVVTFLWRIGRFFTMTNLLFWYRLICPQNPAPQPAHQQERHHMEPASIIRKWGLPVALLCGLVGFFASGLHDLVSWQTVTLHFAKINHFTQQNWLASYAGFAVLYICLLYTSPSLRDLSTSRMPSSA